MANSSSKSSPKVNSVVNALATLRTVAASNRPMGVTEIAREIDINLSSCFNILKTLVNEGFLNFDPSSKKYSLGSGALELSHKTRDSARLFNDIRPKLVKLAQQYNVTVGFWEVRGARLVLTGVADSDAVIRIQMVPGQRLPVGSGAIGRAVAAARGTKGKDLEELLEGVNWYKSPNPRTYAREVAEVQRLGWSVDAGQFIAGVVTVASAIRNAQHEVSYCIATSGFVGRYGDSELAELGEATLKAARDIEEGWFNYSDGASAAS